MPRTESGAYIAAGFYDVNNAPEALPGEKRIYSRNEAGEITAQAWLKNDGSIEISNLVFTITINAAGDVNVQNPGAQLTISEAGKIEIIAAEGLDLFTPGNINLTMALLTLNGAVQINGATNIAGALAVTGTITGQAVSALTVTGTQDVFFAGKSSLGHLHSGVTSGTSNTGPPV